MYKIYKIVDNTNGNVYIGQTKQKYLSDRITCHKQHFKHNYKKNCSSRLILNNDDWFYELIEETDDKSREIYWIQNTPNCINKVKFVCDKKKVDKIYREKNKDRKREIDKKYREENKEYFKEYQKFYREYKNSWGGDPRSNNNLLSIDVKLFF